MKNAKIGIVGPCAAGKSTLAKGLARSGYLAKPVAQEHSFVPAMWQRIANPDLLIYLNVSFSNSMKRRPLNWTEAEFQEQLRRLEHARANADLLIDTDPLGIEEVLQTALNFIATRYNANPGLLAAEEPSH